MFAANGAAFASFASRLPDLQRQHDLGDGGLGLVLLTGSVALMAAQPLAGALSVRVGSRPVTIAGGLVYTARGCRSSGSPRRWPCSSRPS